MARTKQSVSKPVPFSSGIKDRYTALCQNVYAVIVPDEAAGSYMYFRPRPSILTSYPIEEEGGPTTVGYSYASSYTDTNYRSLPLIAAADNIWMRSEFELTWLTTLSGTLLTNYQAISGSGYPRFTAIQNTVDARSELVYANQNSDRLLGFRLNAAGTTLNVHEYTLPFYPVEAGAWLDGYLFYAEKDTNLIYNSDLNDWNTWDPSVNQIAASQYTGTISALARTKQYVLAFKPNNIEYFANAGLINTSPLQRQTQYTKQVGLRYEDTRTLCVFGDKVFFCYRQDDQSCAFYMLEGETLTKISNLQVEQDYTFTDSSAIVSVDGKEYYSVAVNFEGESRTYMYDIALGVWTIWYTGFTGAFRFIGNDYYGDIKNKVYAQPVATSSVRMLTMNGDRSYDSLEGTSAHSPTSYMLNIPPTNFGSSNRKAIKNISEDTIRTCAGTSTLTVYNYNGFGWNYRQKTNSTSAVSGFHNFGMCTTASFTYVFTPDNDQVAGLYGTEFHGLIIEVEDGST